MNDLHHLDFVELMLTDHAACVTPVASRFRAKARGVGCEFERQFGFRQHRVAHKVGERYLAGGDEVQRRRVRLGSLPALVDRKQVLFKFGQLAGAAQGVGVHDVGRVALGVAVTLGLGVQHELGERPVQPRHTAFHHGEACA